MNDVEYIWNRGRELNLWAEEHKPDDDLVWKSAWEAQIKNIEAAVRLAESGLGLLETKVVEYHVSKSIELPVVMIRAAFREVVIFFLIRDNFHDTKLTVLSPIPIKHIPYELVHYEWTEAMYEAEKLRAKNYMKRSRDFDPSLFETDAWLDAWSRSSVIRNDGRMFKVTPALSCYCEGINELGLEDGIYRIYEHGQKRFTIHLGDGFAYIPAIITRCRRGAIEALVNKKE